MRFLHCSDIHGKLPILNGNFNAIISSGDFFPNSINVWSGDKKKEQDYQHNWLDQSINQIKSWLNGKPFFFVNGNHCFADPEVMLKIFLSNGIEAYDLNEKYISFNKINFYGFPYVNYINGMWNYERHATEMQKEVDKLIEVLNNDHIDILVCHSPLAGYLDEGYGSSIIANALDYKVKKDHLPKYLLHGHTHQDYGVAMRNGMLLINSATTQHILEYHK